MHTKFKTHERQQIKPVKSNTYIDENGEVWEGYSLRQGIWDALKYIKSCLNAEVIAAGFMLGLFIMMILW